jgi:predicted RND superfamily exporter protein
MNKVLDHPRLVVVVILAISAGFFAVMATGSRLETDLDKYMPQSHPAFVYSNQAEEWFDIKDGIIIAIEHPGSIYNSGTLEKIKSLTRELQKLDEIEKADVTSLYTADNIIGTELDLDVKAFYREVPATAKTMEDLRNNVRDNAMVFGRLVSTDEKASIIVAEIADDVFSQEFYHRILELAESYEGPEQIYVAGRPIVEGTLASLGPKDMKTMAPLVVLVIVAVLLLLLRSVKNTLLNLSIVLLSTVWVFGLMALLKIPVYSVSTMIPVMLIAIGVADGIHIFSHLQLFLKDHPQAVKKEAVLHTVRAMWKPVIMTSLTTAVGFSALVTSRVFPVKYFGLFTAFGVIVAMFLSLILVPAGVMIFGLPKQGKKRRGKTSDRLEKSGYKSSRDTHFSYAFADWVVRHRYVTLVALAVILIVSVFGITRVWINSSFLDNFSKDSDIVQTDRFVNKHFGGTSRLNVILDSPSTDTLKSPEVLRIVDRIQEDVEKLETIGNSYSLADFLKRMNKVMHADDPAYDRIPESRDLVAQYLLLYEMSGDPDNLWHFVDYDFKRGNLTVQLKSDDSRTIKSAINVINNFSDELKTHGIAVAYAGSGYKSLVFTDLILQGQISSLFLSLVIVVILISLMFRNVLAGFIGSVPIVFTSVVNFGLLGISGISLSVTTALISSIAIGIGIDYAIHFIERYREYAAIKGDKVLAGRLTMRHTGRAILFNAVVVITGFLVLLFSVFPPNRELGAFVALNMFVSFLGTVTVMYLLLYLSNIYFKGKNALSRNKSHTTTGGFT